jgi:hypothetical protein
MIQAARTDSERLARAERRRPTRRLWRAHGTRAGFLVALVIAVSGFVAVAWMSVGTHLVTAWWLERLEGRVRWAVDETNWRQGGVTSMSFQSRLSGAWNSTFGDEDLRYLHKLHRLVSLDLSECDKITSKGLAELRGLEFLTELNLARLDRYRHPVTGGRPVPLDETCLPALQGLERLEMLSLSGNLITDRGVSQIAKMANLKFLELEATEVSDAGLVYLQGMKNLQRVSLGATRVTIEGITKLQSARPVLVVDVDTEWDVERGVKLVRGATR